MQLKNVLNTLSALVLSLSCSLVVAAQACPTCPDDLSQPGNNKGAQTVLLTGPAANNANTLSSMIGGFVSGGGGSQNAGLDVKRYSLSGSTGAAAAPGGKAWNVWGAYSYSDIAYQFSPLRSSGDVKVGLAGIDYTFDNNVILGVAAGYDRTDVDLNFSSGKLTGNGYTVAPYIGMLINKNFAIDATIGFGRTNVDTLATIPPSLGGGIVTGSTHSDRNLGSLGLTYREVFGAWTLTGRAGLLTVHDKLGAYTLSNGTFVPDGTVNLTQARLTAMAAYTVGSVTPYASISYINDLSRPDQAPIGGVAAANDRDAWTPAVGVRFRFDNSLYGSVQYSSEQRSEVRNNQFLINLGIRF